MDLTASGARRIGDVFAIRGIHPRAKLLLITLAGAAGEDCTVTASVAALAKQSAMSRHSVHKYLARLVAEGFIVRDPQFDAVGRDAPMRYVVHLGARQ